MNEVLKIGLSLSLSGALLILVLALLRPLLKDRLSKRWQYYIWLVAVARLLLPFAPEINLMGSLFQGIESGIGQMEHVSASGHNLPVSPDIIPPDIIPPDIIQPDIIQPDTLSPRGNRTESGLEPVISGQRETETASRHPVRDVMSVIVQNLWLGWLMIALILLIRKITIYQSFVTYIRAGCEAADIDLLERIGRLAEQSRVKKTVELYTNNMISTPMLIGYFRPCIVLPSADLPSADFEYTILHELMHCKRGDILYKWLVQFVICVHWPNPMVYRMGREVSRACELSCDEDIIKSLDRQGRRDYGDTLIHAMGTSGGFKNSLAGVTLNESRDLLEERLDAIMGYKKKSGSTVAVTMILTVALLCGASFTGVYAAGADNLSYAPVKTDKTSAQSENSYDREYEKWNIRKVNGIYYEHDTRIRIFMDMREDNSFVNFNYDELGTVDLRLVRAQDGSVKKAEYLTTAEHEEVLSDLDTAKPLPIVGDSGRLTKEEVPAEVLNVINSCDSGKWYVIEGKDRRYIYYNGLPRNYAWQPEIDNKNASIHIFDMGGSAEHYVLLSIPQSMNLTIYYNSERVTYKTVHGEKTGVSDDTSNDVSSYGASASTYIEDFTSPNQSNARLINTQQWAADSITDVEANYITDEVKLYLSPTEEIILKEYLTEDSPDYHAKTSVVGTALKIDRGERPAPSDEGYISRIEIYVPADYNGVVKINTETGMIYVTNYNGGGTLKISSESGCISIENYKGILDCITGTGLITVTDSIIGGNINSNNGIITLGLDDIIGNVEAHTNTGHIYADISKSATFNIQAETTTGVVKNNFSDSFSASGRSFTGKWGSEPAYGIDLSTENGSIKINPK